MPQDRETRHDQYLDELPTHGNKLGQAFHDLELEKKVLEAAQKIGYGAQFGGKYLALDVRIVRLPRHGASCPVGMGVSCSADRNAKAKINKDGIWIEELEREPGRLIPDAYRAKQDSGVAKIDLNRPMKEVLAELSKFPESAPNCHLPGPSLWPVTWLTPSSKSDWTKGREFPSI